MLRKTSNIFIIIVIIGGVLRFIGIEHGFPFIFHPDEPTIARSALGIRFSPNPGHFDWPSLYIYVNYVIFMGFAYLRDLAASVGIKGFLTSFLPILWDDTLIYYLISRILTAVIGTLTIYPVYITARRLFDDKVAILSALTIALLPFHVWQSHYALPDVPMMFFLSWGLYYVSQILTNDSSSNYQSSGFFIGLSASTKYNGALGSVIVPLAHLFRIVSQRIFGSPDKEPLISLKGIGYMGISAIFAILGFIIGTPYAILDYKTFLRTDGYKGALWQFTNVGTVNFQNHLHHLYNALTKILPDDLGYTVIAGLFLCVLIILVRFLLKRATKYDFYALFFALPALVYIYYISGFEKQRSQYYMIAYPFMAIVFAYLVVIIFNYLNGKYRLLGVLFLALVLFPVFYGASVADYRFYRNDTRLDLYHWGLNNFTPDDTIFYDVTLLKPVVDKFPGYHKKTEIVPLGSHGVYFINLEDRNKPKGEAVELLEISSELRLGYTIRVYKIL